MNRKQMKPEFFDSILDKPVEVFLVGGEKCQGTFKKADDKTLTIKEATNGKVLVFELAKVQKLNAIEE